MSKIYLIEKLENRKKQLKQMAIDLLLYWVVAISMLVVRPSFGVKLTARTIILQVLIGTILLFAIRFSFGIYRRSKHGIGAKLYVAYGMADIVTMLFNIVAQRILFYSDRVEVVTIATISLVTLALAVAVRYLGYVRMMRSIDLEDQIPFSPPDISELEIKEVEDTLRSGWITTGPKTKKLEKLLSEYIGVNKCVCLNSQTACGEMALRILGVGPGDEVITCAYTYTATASVISHLGAKTVLVDCTMNPNSLEMDYDKLEEAITNKTKAIIPIDLGGIPCDYDRIFDIVKRKAYLFVPSNEIQAALGRVAVIADGAHALGAEWHGKKVGAIADFTNFSFHAVKNFTTGEGGAISWRHIEGVDDEAIYKRIQLYSLHGQSKDAFAKTRKGGWEYDVIGTWYKCNMTDITAAIGLAQLERYPGLLKRRKQIIEMYDKKFEGTGIEILKHYDDSYSGSGHLYITRIPGISPEQRNEIIVKMADRKVSCNVHYKPLPMLTAYKELGFKMEDYPNAYARFANEITLPLYSTLSNKEVEYIANTYRDVVKEYITI